MGKTSRRLALLCCSGLGLAAVAPAAAAAKSVTTLPANFVTTTSATLHGTIDTGGQGASYEFQYGTTPTYQAATPFQGIPPGSQQVYVAATINQLRPNTAYHFRLFAVFFGVGGNYQEGQAGQDLIVMTKATGRVGLRSTRLHVSQGLVSAPLTCRSQLACKGTFTIRTRAPAGSTGTRACTTRQFSIRPGKAPTLEANVSNACRSLLSRKPGHVLSAQFTAQTRTGQVGANRTIKLLG